MNLLLSLIVLLNFAFLVHAAPDRSPWRTCACGELGHFVKVVGGREARPHSYPWIAALTGFPNEGDYYCGATIISSRYLITAAHCFETAHSSWNWDNIRVNVGAHNLKTKDYKSLKPKTFKIYEGYTDQNDINAQIFDIALIELEEDLEINEKVMPVCLHSKYFNYHVNDLKNQREYDLKRRSKRAVSFAKRFSDVFHGLLGDRQNVADPVDDENENSVESSPKIKNKKGVQPSPQRLHAADQPTDQTKIILDHPDEQLIRQVVKMGQAYHDQIRNDPEKIFDPAKEFTTDKLTVAGWGTIDSYETILPDVLMETEISQKKSEVCENSYGDDVFFRSKMICANDPETDSCEGDSGGPLLTKTYGRMNLYGVISYGRVCGSYSSPGVYTRLSAFLEWIVLHTVEKSRFCPN